MLFDGREISGGAKDSAKSSFSRWLAVPTWAEVKSNWCYVTMTGTTV